MTRTPVTDDAVLAAYRQTGSLRKAAAQIGRGASTVAYRLRKMGEPIAGPPSSTDPLTASVGFRSTEHEKAWIERQAAAEGYATSAAFLRSRALDGYGGPGEQ